jgi:hypothetical protein
MKKATFAMRRMCFLAVIQYADTLAVPVTGARRLGSVPVRRSMPAMVKANTWARRPRASKLPGAFRGGRRGDQSGGINSATFLQQWVKLRSSTVVQQPSAFGPKSGRKRLALWQ